MPHTIRIDFTHTQDNVDRVWPSQPMAVVQAGVNSAGGRMNTAVGAVLVPVGAAVLGGWWIFRNNSVVVGEVISLSQAANAAAALLAPFATLLPGEEIAVRLSATGGIFLFAFSAAGTPLLKYKGFDP